MDIEKEISFSRRVQNYIRLSIEEKHLEKIVIDLLCLAYAYLINVKVEELFVCSGCEEGQNNQLGHDCIMLSSDDRRNIHFEEALQSIKQIEIEERWRDLVIHSSLPTYIIQRTMQDPMLRNEEYVKEKYVHRIRKFANKIDKTEVTLFQ